MKQVAHHFHRTEYPPVSNGPSSSSFLSHVGGRVDTSLGVFRKSNLEPLFNLLEHSLILRGADERDRQTLGTETTGTADTVKIGVGIGRQIVVDGQVDTLDINTTAENVGGNADTLVEFLELLVAFNARCC